MSTIVVGYVDKPEGRAALSRGVAEARLRGAKLIVINSSKGGSFSDSEQNIHNDDVLAAAAKELEGEGIEFDVRALVRGAEPADDLIAVADETKADFIIIGLRKRSPVGKLLLGSNAQRILLDAECPVLAVKAEH